MKVTLALGLTEKHQPPGDIGNEIPLAEVPISRGYRPPKPDPRKRTGMCGRVEPIVSGGMIPEAEQGTEGRWTEEEREAPRARSNE